MKKRRFNFMGVTFKKYGKVDKFLGMFKGSKFYSNPVKKN
jgi:hypothetical protein